jgi:hypothetical protein
MGRADTTIDNVNRQPHTFTDDAAERVHHWGCIPWLAGHPDHGCCDRRG